MITIDELKTKINIFASQAKPFIFTVDYELTGGEFYDISTECSDILWRVGEHSSGKASVKRSGTFFRYKETGFDNYKHKFDYVMSQLTKGNSFLANLTIKTPVETDYSFEEIFYHSTSPYALMVSDKFVCFSPETFIRIEDGRIYSNPMKGTISAQVENASKVILDDYKESAEHFTIVDFIRSDLSRVATNIRVDKLRYIDHIKTSQGEILQVSSLISGDLDDDYTNHIGDIIFKLLPAGSISGAPKESTVRILKNAEGEPRGYYTGIFGYFDGRVFDSAVMIRYIEKQGEELFFRSGGGITINSDSESEYNEVKEKIYLPFVKL